MRSTIPLVYDGLELSESAKWIPTGDIYDGEVGEIPDQDNYVSMDFAEHWLPMPLYTEATDINIGNATEVWDQSYMSVVDHYVNDEGTEVLDDRKNDDTLVSAIKSINLSVDIDFKFWISYNIISPWGWTNGVRFRLAKIGTDKKTLETISEDFYETVSTGLIEKEYSAHHDVFLDKGEKLVLLCKVQSGREQSGPNLAAVYPVDSKSRVTISWKNRINPVEMDLVSPEALLNRVLKSVNDEKDGLTGVIESEGDRRLDNCMILAAESAVRFREPKYIHHSQSLRTG